MASVEDNNYICTCARCDNIVFYATVIRFAKIAALALDYFLCV